jgi:hypothetical protein
MLAKSILVYAIEYAKRGWPVFPVGPNKRPWTKHGVYSASTDPSVFLTFDWGRGASIGIATGEISGIDVLDIDLRTRPICRNSLPIGGQGVPPAVGVGLSDSEGVNGFETLAAFGGTLPETRAATTPSGGKHYWFRHIDGSRSKDLGPGVQWFSNKKLVVAPPAEGREWASEAEIVEAPDWLKEIVLAEPVISFPFPPCRGTLPVPPLATTSASTRMVDINCDDIPEPRKKIEQPLPRNARVPKAMYLKILRLMKLASSFQQRRVIRTLSVLLTKVSGRNDALHWAGRHCFKELIDGKEINLEGACELLVMACEANGYLKKDGLEAVQQTIMSGLGIRKWPERGRLQWGTPILEEVFGQEAQDIRQAVGG